MKNLLKRLDKKAAQWVNELDDQIKEPLVQIVTGEVFTDGTNPASKPHRPESAQPTETPSDTYRMAAPPLEPSPTRT